MIENVDDGRTTDACYTLSAPLRLMRAENNKLLLHGQSTVAVKAKIYGALYKQSSSIAFDETSAKKLLISRLFIGHHTVVWFPLVRIS